MAEPGEDTWIAVSLPELLKWFELVESGRWTAMELFVEVQAVAIEDDADVLADATPE